MTNSHTYKVWKNMKYRCGRKKAYLNVSYAKEWENFNNFYADMGECPIGMTLDRIDPKGNYCKENCRWADWLTQANNRRNNHKIFFNNQVMTLSQVARLFGVNYNTLKQNVRQNKMSSEQVILYVKQMKKNLDKKSKLV